MVRSEEEMEKELDPWMIDIRNIKLETFTQPDGSPVDPRFPFSVNASFSSGIYCYGPKLRTHAHGEVSLALDMQRHLVVEIDRIAIELSPENLAQEVSLMKDLALVSSLRHRHLPEMLGTGISERVPFVVRPFRLGKTLAEVVAANVLPEPVAHGVLFIVAGIIAFLEEHSPYPGACAMGGITSEDIYLAYDGQVTVLGLGYGSLKERNLSPAEADLQSLFDLAMLLDNQGNSGLVEAIRSSADLQNIGGSGRAARLNKTEAAKIAVKLRKSQPEWCGRAQGAIAAMFRRDFPQDIQKDRAFFGLQTLQ